MKALRFFFLGIAALGVLIGQQLLLRGGLLRFELPLALFERLSQLVPGLAPLIGRAPAVLAVEQAQRPTLIATALGAVIFAATSVALPHRNAIETNRKRLRGSLGSWLCIAAVAASLVAALFLTTTSGEPIWVRVVWSAGVLLFLLGSALLRTETRPRKSSPFSQEAAPTADATPTPAKPEQVVRDDAPPSPWIQLILLLVGSGLLMGWQLELLPLAVLPATAYHGLQSLEILAGNGAFFAASWEGFPLLAYYPVALLIRISGDALWAARLVALIESMLVVTGVWLLARQIFGAGKRIIAVSTGGWVAALSAASALGLTSVFLQVGRMPGQLTSIAAGLFGLWLLLRGLERPRGLALGTSGLLLGLSMVLGGTLWLFGLIGAIWLLLLLPKDSAQRLSAAALWLGGAATAVVPFWAEAATAPDRMLTVAGAFGERLGRAASLGRPFSEAAALGRAVGETGPQTMWPEALFTGLLLLGAAVLLRNLNRRPAQLLLVWVGAAFLYAVVSPDVGLDRLLVALLPAAGLLVGLAVERFLATAAAAGPWLVHIGRVLVGGLLMLAVLHNWIGFYETTTVDAPAATHVGRALRHLPPEQIPYLVDTGNPVQVQWDDPVVAFLGLTPYRAGHRGLLGPIRWPDRLPPGGVVLLPGSDQALTVDVMERYPGGNLRVYRSRIGNPVLWVYELP